MQVLDRTGVGTLWSICKTKFALAGHTHSWSQISGAPATATRWPSWGEVTSKPDLKNWSETKSYIDSKAASSGGVDSLPAGTELISYNGDNVFGDKFLKEDGSYYKKTDVQFNLGTVREFNLKKNNNKIKWLRYRNNCIFQWVLLYSKTRILLVGKINQFNWNIF